MYTVKQKQVHWGAEDENTYEWNVSCPFCEGTGQVPDMKETWKTYVGSETYWKEELCKDQDLEIGIATGDTIPEELDVAQAIRYLKEEYSDWADEDLFIMADCEECSEGMYETIWNTVWEIDLSDIDNDMRKAVDEASRGCIVVYDPDGDPWLTLGGCGMDMTPNLCAAWVTLGFNWLPLEWIETLSRNKGYLQQLVSPEMAEKVTEVARGTLTLAAARCNEMLEQWEGNDEAN